MTVESYAKQIDQFLNHLKLLSENQREVLIGENTTDITTTQGHLLMLLAQHGPQTNSELARATCIRCSSYKGNEEFVHP